MSAHYGEGIRSEIGSAPIPWGWDALYKEARRCAELKEDILRNPGSSFFENRGASLSIVELDRRLSALKRRQDLIFPVEFIKRLVSGTLNSPTEEKS